MQPSQSEIAESVARRAHEGQLDKAGASYIENPAHVAAAVKGGVAKAVAWLYDVVEDIGLAQKRAHVGPSVTVLKKSEGVAYRMGLRGSSGTPMNIHEDASKRRKKQQARYKRFEKKCKRMAGPVKVKHMTATELDEVRREAGLPPLHH